MRFEDFPIIQIRVTYVPIIIGGTSFGTVVIHGYAKEIDVNLFVENADLVAAMDHIFLA